MAHFSAAIKTRIQYAYQMKICLRGNWSSKTQQMDVEAPWRCCVIDR